MNYGLRFMTLYRRQGSRSSPWKRNAKKKKRISLLVNKSLKHKRSNCCVLHAKFLQSCLTLATLWTVTCQAPLSKGFSRQEYWSGFPCPTPGDLLDPGVKLASLRSPAMAGGFFINSNIWEALRH